MLTPGRGGAQVWGPLQLVMLPPGALGAPQVQRWLEPVLLTCPCLGGYVGDGMVQGGLLLALGWRRRAAGLRGSARGNWNKYKTRKVGNRVGRRLWSVQVRWEQRGHGRAACVHQPRSYRGTAPAPGWAACPCCDGAGGSSPPPPPPPLQLPLRLSHV